MCSRQRVYFHGSRLSMKCEWMLLYMHINFKSAVAVQTPEYKQKWCPKTGYLTTCAPCTTIPTERSYRVLYICICKKRDRSNRIPGLVAFRCSPAFVGAKSENWSYRLKTAVFRHMPILWCSIHVSECWELKTAIQSSLIDCYLVP